MSKQQTIRYTLSPDHPLVKLFNFMRDRGMIKAQSYEDWRAHRDDPPQRKSESLSLIEAMETARVRAAKKCVRLGTDNFYSKADAKNFIDDLEI